MAPNFSFDQQSSSQRSDQLPALKLNVIRDLLKWRFDEIECRRIMGELEKMQFQSLTFYQVFMTMKGILERDLSACIHQGFLKFCNFGEKRVLTTLVKNSFLMLLRSHSDS